MRPALQIIQAICLTFLQLSFIVTQGQVADQFDKHYRSLQSLRQELTVSVDKYIDALPVQKPDISFIDHVNELRGELKAQVFSAINNSTGGEVVIAINRAKIDLLIEEINTIERIFGDNAGAFTNEFNVLNNREQLELLGKMQNSLASIERDVARWPPSDVPVNLLLRKSELNGMMAGLQAQMKTHENFPEKSLLKAIRPGINFEETGKDEPLLKKFMGSGRDDLFSKKLSFQVELRLHASPNDASLLGLRERKAPPALTVKKLSARPPPSTWNNPVAEMLEEIRTAVFAEQEAIELRDALSIANARTNSTIGTEWIKTALNATELNSVYECFSTSDLRALRVRNERFLARLHNESLSTSTSVDVIEITEIRERVAEIIEVERARKMNSFAESPYLKNSLARGPPLREFESKLQYFEHYIRARELTRLADRPVTIKDIALKAAFEADVNATRKSGTVKPNAGQKVISRQSLDVPSIIANPLLDQYVLKAVPKQNYPVDYSLAYPKNKSWTKNKKELLKNIEKAPGGIIIDGSLPHKFARQIQRAEFDIFRNEVRALVNGKWKKVNISSDWETLRQAWAYVNDQRIAAIDLRPLSLTEKKWFDGPIPTQLAKRKIIDSIRKKTWRVFPYITVVNLNPAFQGTNLAQSLILSDQLIFDLLPMHALTVEGQYKSYTEIGLNVEKLRKAYNLDVKKMIDSGMPPRAVYKSIISISNITLRDNGTAISLKCIPDFAIYRISGSYESGKEVLEYSKMNNSSNWFNSNVNLLMTRIPSLEKLNKLSITIAFFNAVKGNKIANNFSELGHLITKKTLTPDFLFSGVERDFETAINFLEGNLKK